MHELGVVFSIIDTVTDVARENNVVRVGSVTLEIGEVAGIIDDYLQDCWQWAVEREPLMIGAKLFIEHLPATTYCTSCGKTYATVEHGKTCPYCGSEETYLVAGNEFIIKEIEAY